MCARGGSRRGVVLFGSLLLSCGSVSVGGAVLKGIQTMVEGDSLWDLPSFPSVECVRSDVDFGSKELIVCGVLEEEETAEGTGVGLPLIVEGSALKSEFIDLVGDASFRGKVGSSASVTIQSTTGKRQVLAVFGLGARNALMKGTCYKLGAYLASMAKERKSVSQVSISVAFFFPLESVFGSSEGRMDGTVFLGREWGKLLVYFCNLGVSGTS